MKTSVRYTAPLDKLRKSKTCQLLSWIACYALLAVLAPVARAGTVSASSGAHSNLSSESLFVFLSPFPSITVNEGDVGFISFLVQNIDEGPIILQEIFFSQPLTLLDGDATDRPAFQRYFPAGSCPGGGLLAPGQICTIDYRVVTGNPPDDETPVDFGLWDRLFPFVATDTDGDRDREDGDATIQVNDVPEPSSLLLLGSGLLMSVGVVRRRFHG